MKVPCYLYVKDMLGSAIIVGKDFSLQVYKALLSLEIPPFRFRGYGVVCQYLS